MRPLTTRITGTLVLLACTSLSGCALFGGGPDEEPDPELIARNLVNTLAQLPELPPGQTLVQVSTPVTPFGRRVVASLGEAGYGIQEVEADQGSHYVRYRAERAETETGERTRYRVAVGPVSVERDFRVVDGDTLPGSEQRIEGAERQELALNDELFGDALSASLSRASFRPDERPMVLDLEPSDEPELSAANVAASFADAPGGAGAPGAEVDLDALVRENMYDTKRSNYAPLFDDYEDVRQDTLIFPNDSLVLGDDNKAIIADYVRELDPATDVLSVIGCSHGRSAIDNGNELLAIGRANRVKEAFMFAGVSHRQVLDESCWAGSYHPVFPRRGVVLTLKRRQDIG